MVQEGWTAIQEVFAMASPAESIKLLPWCISPVVPSHYISEVFVTTVWLGKDAPATTAVLKLDEPSNSPACLS